MLFSASRSLLPDSEGHKPNRNGFMQQHNINSLMALPCQSWSTNIWCVSDRGLIGLSPRPHVDRPSGEICSSETGVTTAQIGVFCLQISVAGLWKNREIVCEFWFELNTV